MKDYNYDTLAKYYDQLELNSVSSINQRNKVLEKILKKLGVKKILDITCGTGLQAIYLHQKGYDVTASDYSREMIKIAQEKEPQLKFRQGDMRTVRYGKFDAVISIFNAIGHLSKRDFEKAIRNIGENLHSGGIYLFDIFNLDFMKNNFINYEFIDVAKEIENKKFVRFNKNKFDAKKGILKINQRTYIQKGLAQPKILTERWEMKIYSTLQLKDILERNGFEVVEFLNMDGKKLDSNSLSILTVARKR